jgi:hypothetical protein
LYLKEQQGFFAHREGCSGGAVAIEAARTISFPMGDNICRFL